MPPSVPPARSASDHLLLRVSELFHRVPAAQLVLHVCAGAREADGEPGHAHGLQWPHQGLTHLPQLPCANHVQVN